MGGAMVISISLFSWLSPSALMSSQKYVNSYSSFSNKNDYLLITIAALIIYFLLLWGPLLVLESKCWLKYDNFRMSLLMTQYLCLQFFPNIWLFPYRASHESVIVPCWPLKSTVMVITCSGIRMSTYSLVPQLTKCISCNCRVYR